MADDIVLGPGTKDTMRPNSNGAGAEAGWQNVADELASALRATILRNPTVTARDWDRAQAALRRYERAGGERQVELLHKLTDD
jgi:hypothetical protein